MQLGRLMGSEHSVGKRVCACVCEHVCLHVGSHARGFSGKR